jgi:DNA-binding transcriptional MerR regulator
LFGFDFIDALRKVLVLERPVSDSVMSRKKQRDDKVIHVVFGPGGGRVERRDAKTVEDAKEPQNGREPLTDLFSGTEIARLLDVTPARLRTLDRAGVVSPTGRRKGRRAYTFSDLIALRTAQTLLSQRVRLRDVTRAVSALKRTLPKVARPLQELRIVSDGQSVVVHTQDGAFEPLTGQMVLDFDVKTLREDVVRVLRPSAGRERARTAYELYLRASQLDEDPSTMDDAERLYGEAIQLDPWLAIAYTNLGNIRFRRHDAQGAETLYRRALEIDARQPEAQYNLGYVMLERGEPELSIPLFHGAIEADPKFSDAYFNLAMAYEQIGETQKARPFWKNYISLEPSGTWTEIARRHL